jgi:hypothetical protein
MTERISPGYYENLLAVQMAVTAEHIIGRRTVVQFSDSIRGNASIRGTVRKSASGKTAYIMLKRGMDYETSFEVYCHELSHLRHDMGAVWVKGGPRERFPDYIDKAMSDRRSKPIESRAKIQAKTWLDFAGGGPIAYRLKRLEQWKDLHV